MGNRKLIDGKNTEERIEEAWNIIISENLHPNLKEFAKLAKVSTSTLYHNFPSWAKKVATRRDIKIGKRKRSPVTLPRQQENLKNANEQILILQQQVYSLEKKVNESKNDLNKLSMVIEEKQLLEQQNKFLIGGFEFLIEELQLKGVTQERINTIWSAFEKNILPVSKVNSLSNKDQKIININKVRN